MEVYTAIEVAELCDCSISKAYNIIRGLNLKLIADGVPKRCIRAGRISKDFFHEILRIEKKN